jgi:hypothetical protein
LEIFVILSAYSKSFRETNKIFLSFISVQSRGQSMDRARNPYQLKTGAIQKAKKTILADSYLVESQSLSGLSGAPVFVRVSGHHISDDLIKHNPDVPVHELGHAIAQWHIYLIGIWQGAWDAPPGEVIGAERGKNIRVPVGMGVVVPIDHGSLYPCKRGTFCDAKEAR